ncbi:MAG: F0F1 ATP synthase subunit A [Thermoanaerobaculia bacterium]
MPATSSNEIMASAESNPLSHVVQHAIVQRPLDAGLLTPEGKITLFSDHISSILLAGLLLVLVLPRALRRRVAQDEVEALVPTGFRNAIEAICHYLREEVARPSLGPYTDRFVKYVWTIFFFVLTINLLGLLPIAALAPLAGLHLGGTATANVWVTGTLAITTLLMMVVNGLRYGGVAYLQHFAPGPLFLKPLLAVIEVVGVFAKGFALAIRLFANMVAGHTLMAVLLGFVLVAGSASAVMGFAVAVPVVLGSVAISMLELFVAFLQAFIFTFLTTLFIGQSILVHAEGHHEESHAEDRGVEIAIPGHAGQAL